MAEHIVAAAFADRVETLPLTSIVPQKEIVPKFRRSKVYKVIATSLKKVGLIEPLVVFPGNENQYLLVDGHLRLEILKEMGETQVKAIVAKEDEAYTYNRHVSCITGVTQHFMILKAISNGVTEERLAEALGVDAAEIRSRRRLLDGICPEAIELLRDRRVPTGTFLILRRMKPIRQVEAAEHMCATATYSTAFAKALLEVTGSEFLMVPLTRQKITANSRSAQSMLELESRSLVKNLKALETSYGADVLTLTVCRTYIRRLLSSAAVERYLAKHHADLLDLLRNTVSQAVQTPSSPRVMTNAS
jgi:hypothetical protein